MFTNKNLLMLIGRHLLIAAGAVFVAVIAIWFISSKIKDITDTVIKNKHLAASMERRSELFTTLKHDTDLIGENVPLIEKAFPPANDIVDFVSMLRAIALESGATTQTLSMGTPGASVVTGPFPLFTIPYSGSLTGNVATFSKYLKRFEGLPYFTKIQNLTISSPNDWRESAAMSFNAAIQTKFPQ